MDLPIQSAEGWPPGLSVSYCTRIKRGGRVRIPHERWCGRDREHPNAVDRDRFAPDVLPTLEHVSARASTPLEFRRALCPMPRVARRFAFASTGLSTKEGVKYCLLTASPSKRIVAADVSCDEITVGRRAWTPSRAVHPRPCEPT